VTDAVIDLRADCDSQHVFPAMLWFSRSSGKSGLPALTGGRLSKRGKFSAGGQVTADLGTQTAAVTTTLSGKLAAKRSSGAVAVDIVITDKATGQRVDHCAAQDKWKETVPERRVFAGVTDQVAPVVIELSRNRKSVKKFWFGFSAPCTPDGSIAPTDVVTNFRIRHKRFGAAFSDEGSDGAGGTLHVDYSLAGKIGRSSGSGTFSVTATDRDASGAVVSNCPTGSVGWTTTQ
jgi:hypothetical protein